MRKVSKRLFSLPQPEDKHQDTHAQIPDLRQLQQTQATRRGMPNAACAVVVRYVLDGLEKREALITRSVQMSNRSPCAKGMGLEWFTVLVTRRM
jgi:hypothetical protein